ncbi:PREDICTED: BEL1-like homeodomain protein 11 [Populus euphratica]|uniref:BEL1-like homeodomain protein 11 n=1 Tax=Populus euphratica TaxID=75702 RepID=A0AAJ6UG74_POPEU|nr:PREDICTED: BEL1-like homeodomain protein 11 [Populus euphratica]XP_011028918.1 PREDICTED: BEL1-like homeodomain protein 11 [Populus euphratica]
MVPMGSQDSPPNSASGMLHQFIISDSIASQNQFQSQNFSVFGPDLRGSNTFSQSHGVLPSIKSLEERMSRSIDLVQVPLAVQESEISHSRHLMDLLGAANETNHQAQRLSLSLGSQMLVPQFQYRQRSFNSDLMSPSYLVPREEVREAYNLGGEQANDGYSLTGNGFPQSSTSLSRPSTSYGTESFAVAIGNSRYLKPAQSLLEEIVHVSCRAVEISNEKYVGKLFPCGQRGSLRLSSELKVERWDMGLVQAEKHELQLTIAKLIALLKEVEGRYEKYYHQMEEVVSSFEEIAGLGAAKSYTALALQAMSKHFCNLRDAIVSQIDETKRKFSRDLPKISTEMSQLSLFDKETKHNRISLRQLGMMQSQRQAWRPIRGLPETSVTILRSWLFEHFLHPYPNDYEKLMLASQTGLTKNQVSNWFINARVRLWKPMIEEMYKEEFADHSED